MKTAELSRMLYAANTLTVWRVVHMTQDMDDYALVNLVDRGSSRAGISPVGAIGVIVYWQRIINRRDFEQKAQDRL